MSDDTPTRVRWVTATVLAALAERTIVKGGMVTADQVSEWTSAQLTHEQRVHATSKLVQLGFLTHRVRIINDLRVDTYTVTAAGDAAIEATAAGMVRMSGPKGHREPNPVDPEALTSRLWRLVRLRQVIDTDSAARALLTAQQDDEKAYQRMRDTVRKVLRRWELAGALQAGERRVTTGDLSAFSNGNKRYVLVKDTGPMPPRWRPVLRAAQAAAGGAQ